MVCWGKLRGWGLIWRVIQGCLSGIASWVGVSLGGYSGCFAGDSFVGWGLVWGLFRVVYRG